MKPFIVTIEGSVGVGKTTLGKSLIRYINQHAEFENQDYYAEPFNQQMLEQFLSDPKKYAYTFQLYMLNRRQTIYALAQVKNNDCIIDRSLAGDYVFANVQHKKGNITDSEFEVYQQIFDEFAPYKPDVIIFLKTSTEVAMSRIRSRDRNGECVYTPEYIEELTREYEYTLKTQYPNTKIHYVDWSSPQELENGYLPDEVCKNILTSIFEGRVADFVLDGI